MAAMVAGVGEAAPRLAEVLAATSLVTDLAMGEEQGEALRACLLAVRLARGLGVTGVGVTEVYYAAMLRHLGCTATASDEAARFRIDETVLRPLVSASDVTRPTELLTLLVTAGSQVPSGRRVALAARLAASGRWVAATQLATCEVAAALARRLGLGPGVRAALFQQFERWDGKGAPDGLQGAEIGLTARIPVLAAQAVRLTAVLGPQGAVDTLRGHGGWLGPDLVAAFAALTAEQPGLLREADGGDPYEQALAAEPQPWLRVGGPALDRLALALGDLADLKSPSLRGHSRGVAVLAQQAAHRLGMSDQETALLRRAALLHDLGRITVPSRVWDRAGPLTPLEWQAVRLHADHGERLLDRCAALRELAPVVGQHHERLDGSGYPRQAAGAAVLPAARVLAAADCYHALGEQRPHRAAHTAARAAVLLTAEAAAGRLDARAVDAVLAGAERAVRHAAPWPAGLSDREAEMLRLLARGEPDRAIAARLSLAPRAAEQQVAQLCARIGCRTRPAAALFAMEHGMLP